MASAAFVLAAEDMPFGEIVVKKDEEPFVRRQPAADRTCPV